MPSGLYEKRPTLNEVVGRLTVAITYWVVAIRDTHLPSFDHAAFMFHVSSQEKYGH